MAFASTISVTFDIQIDLNSINLKDYSYESWPMESSAGGTLLYITNHLSYILRNHLHII